MDVGEKPIVHLSSIKEGWITKQGRSFVPTWKRRYFVVVENRIEYYADSARTVQKGVYHLDADTEVDDMTQSNPNQFLITGKSSGKMYCRVDPGEDIYDWMAKIQSATPFAVLKPSSQAYDGEDDYNDPMFAKNLKDSPGEDGASRRSMMDILRGRGRVDKNQQSASKSTGFASNTNDMEGWVNRLGGFMKSWKKRYMVLDGNTLKYYTDDTLKIQKHMYIITSSTSIDENPRGHQAPPGEYLFSLRFAERELILAVSDGDLKDEWLRLLMIKKNGGVLPAHMAPPGEEDDYFSKPNKSNEYDSVAKFNKKQQKDTAGDSSAASGPQILSMPSPSPRNSFNDGFVAVAPRADDPNLLSVRSDNLSAGAPALYNAQAPSQSRVEKLLTTAPSFTPTPPAPASSLIDATSKSPMSTAESDPFSSFKASPPAPPPDAFFSQNVTEKSSSPSSVEAKGNSNVITGGSDPFNMNMNIAQKSDPFKAMERPSSVEAIRENSVDHIPRPPPVIASTSENRCESRGSSIDERESFQEPTDNQVPARMLIPTPAEIERAILEKKEKDEKERLRREEEEKRLREEEERIEQEKQQELDRIANLLQVSMQCKSKDVIAAAIKEAEGSGFSNPTCKYYELFLSVLDVSHELDEEVRRKESEEAAAAAAAERESLARASKASMHASMRAKQRDSLDIAPIMLNLPSVGELQRGVPDSDDEEDEVESAQPIPPQHLPHPPIEQNQSNGVSNAQMQNIPSEENLPISTFETPALTENNEINNVRDVQGDVGSVTAHHVEDVDVSAMEDEKQIEGDQNEDYEDSEEHEEAELSMEGVMKVNGQRRYVVLSESTLIFYKEVEKIKKKKGIHTLNEHCSVTLDAEAGPLCFEVKDGKSASNNLKLSVKKGSDVSAWMKALNKAVSRLNGGPVDPVGTRESSLGMSGSKRGSVMVDKMSLVKNVASPLAAMEKLKPQIRGFTNSSGTFTPMGPDYLQFSWLEVKLNTELKWNRMFCTIEKREEQKILRCYRDDDMKEATSSILLIAGQRTEDAVLLGDLVFVLKNSEKALMVTLKALDRSSKNEWCRTIEGIVTDWD